MSGTSKFKRLEREGKVSVHVDPHTGRAFGVVRAGGPYEAKVVRQYLSAQTAQPTEPEDQDDVDCPKTEAPEARDTIDQETVEKELDGTEAVLPE